MRIPGNKLLDTISDFLAQRKGMLPILGIVFVTFNYLLQIFAAGGWLSDTNFFLHLGIIIAILGILLAWAL